MNVALVLLATLATACHETLRRFRSPGGREFQYAPCGRPTRGRQSPRPLDPGLPALQPERRPVIKLREGFARQAAGSFSSPHAGDRQGAASRRGPLTPGSRPAHPPLRGPFAASGFLPDRQDAPSLARPDFRRRPVGSSGNPASAQRVGRPAHSTALIPVPKLLSASLQMPEKHHSLLLFIFSFSSGLPVFSSDCAC